MSSIARTVGVSFNAVNKLLIDAGETCLIYHDKKVRDVSCVNLQCDEIWSFCYAKEKNIETAINPPIYAGDLWTWIALDTDSRMAVSFYVGDRSTASAIEFMADLKSRLAGRVQLTTDGHKAYPEAVRRAFGDQVDFAQLVKMFAAPTKRLRDGSIIKYPVVGSTVRVELGSPDVVKAGTSYVERHNLTMRMGIKRLTRKSNAFSRTMRNHIYSQALYFVHYNFIRMHDSLGMTPAMAAGVTSKVRDMEWLARKIDKRLPKPNRPKRYNKAKKQVVNG